MKIAVTGKGGSGKSLVAGSLARQFAKHGHQVVALDADPNPNLAVSIGFDRETVESIAPILNALLASGHTHNDPQPPAEELLRRFGVEGPDGGVLVATGKIERPSDACLCCGSHNVTRQFFGELSAEGRVVIADLEAGLNDLIWARPGPDDVVVVVSDGSEKAVEIAGRACELAEEMGVARLVAVANRGSDAAVLARELRVPEVIAIPEDPAVLEADRVGGAAFDVDPASPAMAAVAELAGRLLIRL